MPEPGRLFALAQAHHHAGRLDEAVKTYREILESDPGNAEALAMLGSAMAQQGDNDGALAYLGSAVVARPGDAPFRNNLGVVLQTLGRLDDARASFEAAIDRDPGYADPLYNLAKLHKQRGDAAAAIAAYERVIEIAPERADARINLGNILFDLGRLDAAAAVYRPAAEAARRPRDRVQAWVNLGNALRRKGEVGGAMDAYARALALDPHDGLAIKRALTLPVIPESRDHIAEIRADFEARIRRLLERPLAVTDPALETSTTTFFLAYHGLADKGLQKLTAELHLKACPALAFTARHCDDPKPAAGRIKIGLVSAYFRLHSIGRLMRGFVEHLPREVFEVTVFTFAGGDDALSRLFAEKADHLVLLPAALDEARRRIAEAAPDILLYADLGMDVRTYFLAFARLAPVQCVTWGHPDTTGIPNIDYFVSSALTEPGGAEAHYSERLRTLKTLPTYYPRPDTSGAAGASLGTGKRVYFCPQTVIKFHPDFDLLAGQILRGDADAEVVMIEGPVGDWSAQVKARMARAIPDAADRVRVIPRVGPEEFLGLLKAADVILDTPHFSGGNTSYEAFALGKPVVTLDGEFMRGRVTAGQYRMMGIDDLTANSVAEMAEIALRLGTDGDYRADAEARIRDAAPVLFNEAAAIDELARFFEDANAAIG